MAHIKARKECENESIYMQYINFNEFRSVINKHDG